MTDGFWKQKLMAFLHDPPCKPLDILWHERIGEAFIRQAGLDPSEMDAFQKVCDRTAAAADRFPFPSPSALRSDFDGSAETPFHHPLGQSNFAFENRFASLASAEEVLQVIQTGLAADQVPEADRAWANFFLHWRRWPIESARRDSRTYFLPADTRIPDHNVWTHNSVVSALQGCVRDGRLEPAFLIFQMGPVQSFIEQARSTRDLWSGSYLLSWLVAQAIKAITDEVGPDAVIFPALRAQPLFDLLHRDRLYQHPKFSSGKGEVESLWERMQLPPQIILTPNLPNRFLAIVPQWSAANLARTAEQAIHEELQKIADASWHWISERLPLEAAWRTRFESQIRAFPQVTWQICPWEQKSAVENLRDFKALCAYSDSPAERLAAIHEIATKDVPFEDRDARYFSDTAKTQLNNSGFCWSYFYALTDWLLAARRNTRNFAAWNTDENQTGAVKDSFSGTEEAIGSEAWWKTAREKEVYLFRSDDRLGAMNLIKRVWHWAYLERVYGLDVRKAVRFESVPGVAAGKWREQLKSRIRENTPLYQKVVDARAAISRCAAQKGLLADPTVPIEEWLEKTEPECLLISTWRGDERGDQVDFEEVRSALAKLYDRRSEAAFPPPPAYYAVIALDGDEMGKWVSGEKTPHLLGQLSKEAAEYFRSHARDKSPKAQRPLSPSYHLQFSEALGNFGLYLARPVVEHFGGQLIYSGGDDVLAMVSAGAALDCAEALNAAFRGQPRLVELVEDTFEVCGSQGGFVRLVHPNGEEPTWPLIVPGPAARASVGMAIGHIHSPLQNLIGAARAAENRAKNEFQRAACAVSLYKRSGEILEWGFKWDSGALELYRLFSILSSGTDPLLPSRFGYALNELLVPYQSGNQGLLKDADPFPVVQIIKRELGHVLRRQGKRLRNENAEKYEELALLCEAYLGNIATDVQACLAHFPMLFNVSNFINRGEE